MSLLVAGRWFSTGTPVSPIIECSQYANMTNRLFHNLSWLPNDCAIDLKLLTNGNPILSNEQSEIILSTCLNISRGLKGRLSG